MTLKTKINKKLTNKKNATQMTLKTQIKMANLTQKKNSCNEI